MQAMYKDIVEFAELERFMDQKLKNYSSGMQVRLAFSIAIRAQSEILVLDEVLAVGDLNFQRKCLAIFDEHKAQQRTIVIVTHDMAIIERYCTRALLLDGGEIQSVGSPVAITQRYSTLNQQVYEAQNLEHLDDTQKTREYERISGIKYKLESSHKASANRIFESGEEAVIKVSWESGDIKNIGIALLKQSGEYVYGTNTAIEKKKINNNRVEYRIKLAVTEGDYHFLIGFFGANEKEQLYFAEHDLYFTVNKNREGWGGIVKLDHSWR
jgi:ABC-2 type transport system ATP-binding protein